MTGAPGPPAVRCDSDLLGGCIREVSLDAGTRWMLNDAIGKPLLTWDSRMYRLRHEYDALHRPTTLHVRGGDGVETIAERDGYREGQANDLGPKLRGGT